MKISARGAGASIGAGLAWRAKWLSRLRLQDKAGPLPRYCPPARGC
jgi:hypothetical protein